ncbi:class I SAM-dependent methyltransferase [Aquipuribacter nitratireducens]|uniref:Class I SAM-dependent methyltransferase n=1 Tax=Aquipuribacter nitratireducens TaxID=650104 RepID=A0ABW0GV23_9MICO
MSPLRGAGPVGGSDDGSDDGNDDGSDDEAGGYDVAWLDLRADADDRARSDALLADLGNALRPGVTAADPPGDHVLDLGCGTGAMARWCLDRFGPRATDTVVTLVDPDGRLLEVARSRLAAAPGRVLTTVAAGCDDLARLLADPPEGRRVDAVVASALLDVVPAASVVHLARAVAGAGVPLLAALTVTGTVRLDPQHPWDEVAAAAVARTARRDGAAGPGAAGLLVDAATAQGCRAVARSTPWHLDPARDGALVAAWWEGYAAAARHGARTPEERTALDVWAADHRSALERGALVVQVGHDDVLVLPGHAARSRLSAFLSTSVPDVDRNADVGGTADA